MANITLTIPTPQDFRNQFLRVVRNGLIKRGVANPNVTDNSDYAIKADALAQQLSVATSQQPLIVDGCMPDTATGTRLLRWLAIYGLAPRPAQGASGPVIHSASAPGLIATGAQLYDDKGQVFEVTTGGTYANGDEIPVDGITTGKATNHEAGDVLQWVKPPPFSDSKVLVGTGGLIGGIDDDTEETSRRRLLAHLKNVAGGGNWAQIVATAEQASASVQAAFCYPALDGPSTYGVCVVGQLTYDAVNGFNRAVSPTALTDVIAAINAAYPEHAQPTITTPSVLDVPDPVVQANVAIGLTLPAAPTATPPGPGGGWEDGTPWPNLLGSAVFVSVSAVTSGTAFTITSNDAASCPTTASAITSSTQISWFDAAAFAAGDDAIKTSTVLTVGGSTGAVTVTIDPLHPFSAIAIGDFIFPAAENMEAYAQAFLAAMADMGPGEWTTDVARLANGRAFRQPKPTQSSPSSLGGSQLKAISNSGDEVLDVSYLYRGVTTPDPPPDTTTSPEILVPNKLGFWPI